MSAIQPLLPDVDFAYDEVPDLHALIDRTRPHGSVVPVTYHGQTAWLINSYEELKQAFSDEEHFTAAAFYRVHAEPSMGRTMQTMAGEQHRINRALVSNPFFPKQVRAYVEAIIEPEANRILDAIETCAEVDLVKAFTLRYPFSVITRLLDIPVHDDDKFMVWAVKIIDYPWDPEGALRARREFEEYLRPYIHRRRREPGDDLISLLATAEIEGQRLSDDDIFGFCLLIFPAGSDTTYKNLGSLLYAALGEPGIRERVAAGDQARAAIVQEGLRWQPPTALLPRTCSKDTELGGVALAAGTPMLFGITAANNDPAVFAEPRRFDPDRNNKNLAFGHGVHFCLGSHLARSELETAIRLVCERFPRMRLMAERPVEIIRGVLRGPRDLWVRPHG
jgi:cytochrome P450